jgi:hypothetical protein
MTARRRKAAIEDSSIEDLPQSDTQTDYETDQTRSVHPVKSFFLPNSWISQFLSVPSQIVFAIAGMMGLANYARNIIRIKPKRSGALEIRGNGGSEPVAEWIEDNVPSIRGSFKPSWWLPKSVMGKFPVLQPLTSSGHLQTIFSVIGNFNNVDKVEYKRLVFLVWIYTRH